MGNVVAFNPVRPKLSEGIDGKEVDQKALGRQIEAIVEAIDAQKAEIAVFRARMEQLRLEMKSLDASMSLYKQRLSNIPHGQLNRAACRLETLMTDGAPRSA